MQNESTEKFGQSVLASLISQMQSVNNKYRLILQMIKTANAGETTVQMEPVQTYLQILTFTKKNSPLPLETPQNSGLTCRRIMSCGMRNRKSTDQASVILLPPENNANFIGSYADSQNNKAYLNFLQELSP